MRLESLLLLERESELGAIAGCAQAAARGQGCLVVVEAAAGLGKTALVDAAEQAAAGAGMAVRLGRGSQLERGYGHGVVRQLLEGAVRDDADPDALLAGPARLAGALLGMAADRDSVPEPGPGAAFAVLHALYWLTVGLAERRPLALVVDDAHWADPASQRFLAYLAARLEGSPVLVVVAARPPHEDDGLLSALLAAAGARVLAPRALGVDAAARLVRQAAPQADDAVCQACHAVTGGNPYYLLELARQLAQEGSVQGRRRARGRWSARPRASSGEWPPAWPRLAASARQLAFATRRARRRRARASRGGDRGSRRKRGRVGRRRAARRRHPGASVLAGVRAPDPGRRRRRADAVRVRAPPRTPAPRVCSPARVLPASGSPRTCWRPSRPATSGSASVSPRPPPRRSPPARPTPRPAFCAARSPKPPTHSSRAGLLLELGNAELLAFEFESAGEHLRAAYHAAADPGLRARAALALAEAQLHAGQVADAVGLLDQELQHWPGRRRLRLPAGGVDLARGAPADRRAQLAVPLIARLRAHVAAERDPDPALLVAEAAEMTMAAEPVADLVPVARRALAGVDDDAPGSGQDRLIVARCLAAADETELAAEAFEVAFERARRLGSPLAFAWASGMRAELNYWRGAIADAEADARNAYRLAPERRWTGLPWIVGYLVAALVERERLDEAQQILAHAELQGPPTELPDATTVHVLLFARGLLRRARGQTRAAVEDLLECGRRELAAGDLNPALIAWRSEAARALHALGDDARARELVHEELELALSFGAPRAIGTALRATAMLSNGLQRPVILSQAIDVLSQSPARLEHARALTDLGEQLARERTPARPRATCSTKRSTSRTDAGPPRSKRARGTPCAPQARDHADRGCAAPTPSPPANAGSPRWPRTASPTATSPKRSSSPYEPSNTTSTTHTPSSASNAATSYADALTEETPETHTVPAAVEA